MNEVFSLENNKPRKQKRGQQLKNAITEAVGALTGIALKQT